jgi:hypothetical protein
MLGSSDRRRPHHTLMYVRRHREDERNARVLAPGSPRCPRDNDLDEGGPSLCGSAVPRDLACVAGTGWAARHTASALMALIE